MKKIVEAINGSWDDGVIGFEGANRFLYDLTISDNSGNLTRNVRMNRMQALELAKSIIEVVMNEME
jgi:hypothetical protein